MTRIQVPDPPLHSVMLAPDERQTLGSASSADPQHDRISVGRPAFAPLDLETVDADSRVFVQSRPGSAYWLLAVTCSFRALDDKPIETAWLELRLETIRPDGMAPPTAWSMEPLVLQDPTEITSVVTLDASLKLKSGIGPVEGGPSAKRETTEKLTKRRPYLEAFREGTDRPSWIFTRTESTDVRGVHRLRAVAELPAGASGQVETRVGATLRLKRFGLVPYRANLDDVPDIQRVVFG